MTNVDYQVLRSSLKIIINEAQKLGDPADKIRLEAEAMARWIDEALSTCRRYNI